MSLKLDHLPESVAQRLRQYYHRKRLWRLLRIVLGAALLYAGLVLIAAHLDRFLFLERSTRVLMFWVVHVAVLGLGAAAVVRLLLRRGDVRQIGRASCRERV